MGVDKILENKLILGPLMKIAKKAFTEDGLKMIVVTTDKDGNLTAFPYKEPMVVIPLADKIKYDNLLMKFHERQD